MVTRTYEVRTYGCQMNAHDSERVAGLLDEAGYAPVADGAQTDVVVFSTCAVRENADNKLDGNLGHLKPVKDRTPGMPPLDRFVVVCRSSYGTGWTGDHGSISPGYQLAGNGAALSPTPPWT
jgi:tRNA A37 methylthiotransferase MiaB